MFEKIIALDKQLIVYLNNLGSKNFDWFWLLATKQFNWAPIFIFVFYILYKKLGLKKFGWAIFFIALIILFADQTANLFKNSFERVRPCNDLSIVKNLRFIGTRVALSVSFLGMLPTLWLLHYFYIYY